MSQAMINLLIDLADPTKLERFNEDPEAVMTVAGLTEADKTAIRSRNGGLIQYQAKSDVSDPTALKAHAEILITDEFTAMDGYLDVTHVMTSEVIAAERQEPRFGYLQSCSASERSDFLRGTLIVVGTGIQLGQMTAEARGWIEKADKVLYCVSDFATEELIQRLNASAESLHGLYGNDKPRIETYHQMANRALECVRQGLIVCLVFYGHPGIFVFPSHEAIRVARLEGHRASMLPAVSSLDGLFADLGVDPAVGCQLIEATDLLIRNRRLDTQGCVVIWQCEAVGDLGFNFNGFDKRNLPILQTRLEVEYGPNFECVVYQAAHYPVCGPVIQRIQIRDLTSTPLSGVSTLFFPPLARQTIDFDMVKTLGMERWIWQKARA
jgi:hypothetical protein